MKILVTGATGFVGGKLTRKLLSQGHEIHVIQRNKNDRMGLKELNVEHHIADVTDPVSLERATKGMEIVCHLAGVIGYSKAMREIMEKVNVLGTQNVIDACLKNRVKRLLYMSSVAAVGASFDKIPLTEDSPYNLSYLNIGYFETKRKAEILVLNAVAKHKLDAVLLNPSTIYGPEDARKGSRGVQLKIAKGQFPFYTSGGVNVISIEDVVNVIISAIDKGRAGERYIVAGENILIKDLFKMIAQEAGVKEPHIYLPNLLVRAIGLTGDYLEKIGKKGPLNSENAWASIMYHWFNSDKAKSELGLNPKPAREAIAQSVQWVKENL